MTHSGLLITWANADASISGHHVFDHGDLFSRCGVGAVFWGMNEQAANSDCRFVGVADCHVGCHVGHYERRERMKYLAIGIIALACSCAGARAQEFDFPGVHMHGPFYGGEERHGWHEREWGERRHWGGGHCRRLRAHCIHKEELGEEGEGNCRRYREECGG